MNSIEVLKKDSEYAKYRKKFSILRVLFSPMFFVVMFFILEIFILVSSVDYIKSPGFQVFIIVLNIVEVLYILNSNKIKDSFKITCMIVCILMPIFGVIIYFALQFTDLFTGHRSKLKDIVRNSRKHYDFSFSEDLNQKNLSRDESEILKLANSNICHEYTFMNYFYNYAKVPAYNNASLYYFNNGKDAFEDIISKLKSAKKFIFIEIFILADGIIWQEILKILKEKAKEGVEVKILVDGLNSILRFNNNDCRYLKSFNIDAKIFKPIFPLFTLTQNHRDHRKIFVIDNEIAYTGGINIADEYANLYERFGYWKDACIRVEGKLVTSFTVMFLQLWSIFSHSKLVDFDKYLPENTKNVENANNNAIYVPYSDYPNLPENISLEIYSDMFNSATKYMYIMTPYLVIDESVVETIESAAKRGVDVKIIVPRIPDKKYVFYVNRSYYRSLVLAGAKIYEYVPGFIHSKVFLQDGIRAVVGTANLDYRSLYMHYENGLYFYGDFRVLKDIKADFDKTLAESREMTINEIIKMPVIHRFFGAILKVFAPLM